VTVVEMGPVGLSLADTVTVLDDVQVRLRHSPSGICVGSRATDRSAPTVIVPLEAQPNSSEMTVNRPLTPIEYVKISRHGGAADPSSFENTKRLVSVQTWRPPVVEQLSELLEKFVPFGEVSAATGPIASNRLNGTARNATANRRTKHLLLTSRRIRGPGTRLARVSVASDDMCRASRASHGGRDRRFRSNAGPNLRSSDRGGLTPEQTGAADPEPVSGGEIGS
jgi:hypothetical protein